MRHRIVLQALIGILIALALPVGAMAQSNGDTPSTIQVHGYGTASAPADTATIQLVVGDSAYGGPPQPPSPDATPGAQERRAVAPVVSALVTQGVPEGEIDVIVGSFIRDTMSFGGPATAVIRFTIDSPTTEQINGLVDAATIGAAEERLIVGRIAVLYDVEDCAPLEREAREMAISDAEARADVQAELLGVSRGDLVASHDVPAGIESVYSATGTMGQTSGCSPADIDTLMLSGYSPSMFDPTAEPEVVMQAQVELTFKMSSAPEATPSG